MKIMVYEGCKDLKVQEIESFPLGKGQVRVKTICSGISHGTEMGVYRGIAPFFQRTKDPVTGIFRDAVTEEKWSYPFRSCDPGVWYMGYSAVGEVVELGEEVNNVKAGDIVYMNAPHQSESVKWEAELTKLPENVKPEEAVVFTNLMTAFNGVLDSRIKLGDNVVVSGLGVLGQLVVQMAKMSGAATVIGVDVFPKRLKTARENGADYVVNSNEEDGALAVRKLTGNKGADLVIEVSGNQKALNNAIRMAGDDTVVTALGWYQGSCGDINLSEEFHHNRIILRSSQSGNSDPSIRGMWDHGRKVKACIRLLSQLKIDNLITHRIPFEKVSEAYEMIDKDPSELIQVVLTY